MRKTLVIITLLILGVSLLFAQYTPEQPNLVDIAITDQCVDTLVVTLYPRYRESAILSNVVFTVRWPKHNTLSFGNVLSPIPIYMSGPEIIEGDYRYQIFSGVGLEPSQIGQPIRIQIEKSQAIVDLEISNDLVNHNGLYFVSVGGIDVTGRIITQAIVVNQNMDVYRLYFDPAFNRYLAYVPSTGFYYGMSGQLIHVRDSRLLVPVLK